MKILAPISNVNETKKIIEAGANELYCGVLSKKWKNRYTNVASLNFRDFSYANLKNYKELKQVVEIAHSYDVPVFLTINAPFYSQVQYNDLIKEIGYALNTGIDALIISDLATLLYLNKTDSDIPVHLSTVSNVSNTKSMRFYKNLRVKRVTLAQQLSLDEISKVNESANFELETFIRGPLCKNVVGFCTYNHGLDEFKSLILTNILHKVIKGNEFNFTRHYPSCLFKFIKKNYESLLQPSACYLTYKISNMNNKKFALDNLLNWLDHTSSKVCGACFLFELEQVGIKTVKIMGRSSTLQKKIKDISYIQSCLNLLEKNINKKDFKQITKTQFFRDYGYKCNSKMCYYNTIKE